MYKDHFLHHCSSFSLEGRMGSCNEDQLQIRWANQVEILCSDQVPNTRILEASSVLLLLQTNSDQQFRGFSLKYKTSEFSPFFSKSNFIKTFVTSSLTLCSMALGTIRFFNLYSILIKIFWIRTVYLCILLYCILLF